MKLSREFYQRNTLEVARELLGKQLVHHTPEGIAAGKIIEVEAYMGPDDAASHSYKGLRSKRTEIMFGPGGFAYVYLIYGMYHCFNIITNISGEPHAVLIRALEPFEGIELMKKRRKTAVPKNLCSGPGKLCSALGITSADNRTDLCGDSLYLLDGSKILESDIVATPRINIDYSGEARDYLWRFIIK